MRTQKRCICDLQQELIIEILLRLPVKSLLCSKSVCKSWFSLISDPHFAISHFELAAARTDRLLFIASSAPKVRSIDFNASLHDDSTSAVLKCEFLPPKPKPYTCNDIIGTCRGFLLLDLNYFLCVWNPSTGVHKYVDWSSNIGLEFFVSLRGFGYDPSTDDYLVVQASYNPSSDDAIRVEFFSLRANAWKEIEAIHLPFTDICVVDSEVGSFLNGAIHWLASSHDISKSVIVAFDLTQRIFSEVPLSVDFEYHNFYYCHLGVLGELLSLSAVGWNHSDSVEIWVMKEYKVQSSWTKTIVVYVHDIPTRYFSLICSTKSGDIVGTDGSTGLAKCNDEGQLQEHRSYCNGPFRSQVAVYTESLLSLPCDSS